MDIDVQNEPDFLQFKKDLTYISNAECNIILGIGGCFVMSSIFSQKVITYIENIEHSFFDMCDNVTKCRTWTDFEKELVSL